MANGVRIPYFLFFLFLYQICHLLRVITRFYYTSFYQNKNKIDRKNQGVRDDDDDALAWLHHPIISIILIFIV